MNKDKKPSILDARKALTPSKPSEEKVRSSPQPKKRNRQTLQQYIEYSNDLTFENSTLTRIDSDAISMLRLIKNKKKDLKINKLISALLKDFFEKHNSEIADILKDNKYL